MAYWIYKCNKTKTSYAPDRGDWAWVFEQPWESVGWGAIEDHPELGDLKRGDTLLCQQSDVAGKLLVGLAKVEGVRRGRVLLRPTEEIGALIRPLKLADARIAKLPALQGGVIKTAYPLSKADAERLIRAARAQVREKALAAPRRAKWRRPDEEKLRSTKASLQELPAAARAVVLREMKVVIRSALLRQRVLQHWPPECAACGSRIEIGETSECQVAHIRDVHKKGADQLRNSIPLCRTHHWAFDAHLWAIHPETTKVVVRKSLRRNPALRSIHGRRITRPDAPQLEFLGSDVLRWRWAEFRRATAGDL